MASRSRAMASPMPREAPVISAIGELLIRPILGIPAAPPVWEVMIGELLMLANAANSGTDLMVGDETVTTATA